MSTWYSRAPIVAPPSAAAAPALAAALVLALSALATGCTPAGGNAGPAAPDPSPSGEAAQACRALHERLPERLAGQGRQSPEPESAYTAAWGDPAVELRCGVPKPDKLTPGSEHYNPTADAVEVNGVSWLIEPQEDGHRFTTTGRATHVELTVPADYAPEISVLTDLAAPVKKAVPLRR